MPKEASQVSFGYKDQVEHEAVQVGEEMGMFLNSEVVRFPGHASTDAPCGSLQGRDFLILDVAIIKKISGANMYAERDKFSRELLRRLGFIEGVAAISLQMAGVHGNKVIELDHKQLPYKAEMLVHNMGNGEYLISGFVISPK